MRHARGLLVVLALMSSLACTDSGSRDADPLQGVNAAVAERLCKGFFANAEALRTARNTISPDRVDAAASGYERLAVEAGGEGAKVFASEVSDAADAAHVLAQHNRDVLASGPTGTASDTPVSQAALLTKVMRLQLPETQLSLACYSRGHTQFES